MISILFMIYNYHKLSIFIKKNMKINNLKYFGTLSLILIMISCSKDEENIDSTNSTIWKNSVKTFVKLDGADPTDEINQDKLTENVWITRGNDGGQIFNAAKEESSNKSKSPVGTKWAIGLIDDYKDLSFYDFRIAIKPKTIVGKDLVLYLEEDDIYLSIKFTSWSQGQKGGFSYERSTP